MRPFAVLFGTALCLFGAYGYYLYAKSDDVPKTLLLSTSDSFKTTPPTVCSLQDDAGIIGGTLHLLNSAARFDLWSLATGAPVEVHIIVDSQGNGYVWREGERAGASSGYPGIYEKIGLSVFSNIKCSLWWVPDGNMFIVPQNVSFAAKL